MGRKVLLAVALLLAGGLSYVFASVGMVINQISDPVQPQIAPEGRPAAVQAGQRINILVMGLDDDRLRTDTLMLVSVDPETRKAGVLGIPRDTRAMLAGHNTMEKINGAYAYGVGDKQFPPNLRALKTVEDLLDVQVHYTVVVDLEAFRQAIDEIDGVWVDIPFEMEYDDPEQALSIRFQPGRQKLNGRQALEFVRWRHNNDGTGYPDGDLGRIRTQQQFIRSLMDEVLKPGNLLDLPGQALSVARFVETTMEPSRITSLAVLAGSVSRDDVEFATLPGITAHLYDERYDAWLSYFLPDPLKSRQLVDRLIRGVEPKAASDF